MARKRSPRYPSIALSEAIKSAQLIYQKEHLNPMDRETAVISMGYSSLNGASARRLASLISFGLLEGRDDNITVTSDAITIIADEKADDQRERGEALIRCLNASQLFQDLSDRYPHTPSVANIASYLMKNGFKPDAAKTAANIYKESVAYVELELGEHTVSQRTSNIGEDESTQEIQTVEAQSNHIQSGLVRNAVLLEGSKDMRQETFALDTGNVTIQWPAKMSKDSYDDFSDWLDILKRKVKRSVDSSDWD